MTYHTRSAERVLFTSTNACRHDDLPAVRWDYLTPDENQGSGSIVCRSCGARLGRVRISGGNMAGEGFFFEELRDAVFREGLAPSDLEVP